MWTVIPQPPTLRFIQPKLVFGSSRSRSDQRKDSANDHGQNAVGISAERFGCLCRELAVFQKNMLTACRGDDVCPVQRMPHRHYDRRNAGIGNARPRNQQLEQGRALVQTRDAVQGCAPPHG
jgi:hypothetical protein